MQLRFTKLHPDAVLPQHAHEGDAGSDLCCVEAVSLGPGRRTRVRTGIAVAIPEGHAGLVLPRSGLAHKHGVTLTNTPGLIDSGYRGELQVLLLNTDPDETFTAEPGDRIAQLVVVPYAAPTWVEVDAFEETQRGLSGFGSSGT